MVYVHPPDRQAVKDVEEKIGFKMKLRWATGVSCCACHLGGAQRPFLPGYFCQCRGEPPETVMGGFAATAARRDRRTQRQLK